MKTQITLIITTAFLSACASTGSPPADQPGGDSTAVTAAAAGVKPYPLKTCIVTDNGLETMGGSVRLVHNGQEIKFCCKPCIAKFKKNPEKYLAKLR